MKTFNKRILNNKGAALVSVMIAIAFVTILSTTLLYISMNNYQMKVVNTKSKENFYDADDKMVTMTARMQNTVATTKASQIKTAVTSAIGCGAVTTTTVGGNTFEVGTASAESLAKIVFPNVNVSGSGITGSASAGNTYTVKDSNGEKYVFSSADYKSGPKLKADGTADGSIKKIEINNVEIKKLSATSAKNSVSETTFEDKIKTDMSFEYYEPVSSPSDGGVGTFSLLADSTVKVDNSDNVRLNIYGNAYMSNYNTSHMSDTYTGSDGATHILGTQPGGTALTVGNHALINILGDNFIVYGDCIIDNGGVLNIAHGSLTVFGDLKVKNGGTLLVGGSVYMSDEKVGTNYKHQYAVDGGGVVKANSATFNVTRIDPEPFKHALKLDDTDSDNDGVVKNITKKAKLNGNGAEVGFWEQVDSEQKKTAFTYDGKTYYVNFYNKCISNGSELKDSLLFVGDKGQVELQEGSINSTIISLKPFNVKQQHTVDLTCLSDGVFNYATGKNASGNYNVKGDARTKKGDGWFYAGDFFTAEANQIASAMLGGSTGGGGGSSDPVPDKVTSRFSNWKKN